MVVEADDSSWQVGVVGAEQGRKGSVVGDGKIEKEDSGVGSGGRWTGDRRLANGRAGEWGCSVIDGTSRGRGVGGVCRGVRRRSRSKSKGIKWGILETWFSFGGVVFYSVKKVGCPIFFFFSLSSIIIIIIIITR